MGNKTSAVLRVLNPPNSEEKPPAPSVQQHITHNSDNSYTRMFSYQLPRQLNMDDSIIFEGKNSDDAETFSINLVCDRNPNAEPLDIAYHYKILYDEYRAYLSSKIGGSWLDEEDADILIERGEEFNITIVFKMDGIHLLRNGNYHSRYENQLDFQDIRHVQFGVGIEKIYNMTVKFADI